MGTVRRRRKPYGDWDNLLLGKPPFQMADWCQLAVVTQLKMVRGGRSFVDWVRLNCTLILFSTFKATFLNLNQCTINLFFYLTPNFLGDVPLIQRKKIATITDRHYFLHLPTPTLRAVISRLLDELAFKGFSGFVVIQSEGCGFHYHSYCCFCVVRLSQ